MRNKRHINDEARFDTILSRGELHSAFARTSPVYPRILLPISTVRTRVQMPPRKKTDHLVGARMLIVAYGTIGMFETIAAFVAFFYTFDDYGFLYKDISKRGAVGGTWLAAKTARRDVQTL